MRDGATMRARHPAAARLAHCIALAIAVLGGACTPAPPPPPRLFFAGLPVSGDVAFARQRGFVDCIEMDAVHLRCRRHGTMLFGEGGYEAAVDLRGGKGESGFEALTLWSDDDQDAIYRLIVPLARAGWTYCYTGTEQVGDQAIFTKPGQPVRLSIDISYYGKRRARIFPNANPSGQDARCTPDASVLRFGADIAKAVAR